ncbi:TonB-dependent receptor [Granulicella mallensis]|uniref:TonB-dependent transporter Oar-like beta-barrel domain-containing protein n=1 Tax=Granulicella mallensis TaxID=940614 RepID=A0A7W7ZSP7_9BACT|nr:TonB-dependent receptor [Granulicella mallensis]MBB5065098.1 hypothetical protein [Granulicella mallensis]
MIRSLLHQLRQAVTPFSIVGVLICLLLSPDSVIAQASGRGTIQGTITDPSGALVPEAMVTATEVNTNVVRQQKATRDGFYAIAAIDPGTYRVTVAAPGFKTFTHDKVVVDAIQVVGLDFELEIGSADSVVTVTTAPPQLNTTNATLGSTIESDTYRALPLQLGNQPRDPTGFVALTPGVTGSGGVLNFNGGQANLNETYVDGVAMDDVNQQSDWAVVHSTFSVDAVDQFNAQTSSVSAAYQGVGLQNYVHKSGTNVYHGALFEYFRNTALDAWGTFAKHSINAITGAPIKPVEHNNEFGGTFGGYIPHFKDKIFFFFSYDNTRFLSGTNPSYQTVPTVLERQGNFTELAAAGQPVYDPKSTVCGGTPNVCTRGQFSYKGQANVIDPARLSPISQYMQQFLPTPSNGNLVNNYLGGFNTGFNYPRYSTKVDLDLIKRHRISILFLEGGRVANPACCDASGLPQPYLSTVGNTQNNLTAMVSDTWTISDHTVNRLTYAFNAGSFDGVGNTNPSAADPKWWASAAGITNVPAGQASDSFPRTTFGGSNAPTSWTQSDTALRNPVNVFHIVDSFQTVKGIHSISAGGEVQWQESNNTSIDTGTYLSLSYSNNETAGFNPNSATLNTKQGGGYASFLIGAVDGAGITDNRPAATIYSRYMNFSPYVQDDIKLTRKLTVNAGLRWDLFTPWRETENRFSYLSLAAINPVTGTPGALRFGGNGDPSIYCNCTRPVQIWYKNFGPRFGFAYAIDPKTILRGGFSLTFTHGGGVGGRANASSGSGQLGFNGGSSPSTTNGGITPAFYLDSTNSALPSYTLPPSIDPAYGTGYTTTAAYSTPVTVTYADPYLSKRSPYSENFNFGLQRQLMEGLTLSADYAGANGKFLPTSIGRGIYSNQLDPQYYALGSLLTASASAANVAAAQKILPSFKLPSANYSPSASIGQALRPFAQYNGFSDIWGNVGTSTYNALQIQLTQQQRWGLNYGLAYTWAKTMDDTGTSRSAYGVNGIPAGYVERSPSASVDIPNRISLYAVYNAPFGKSGPWIERQLVKNWTLSTILQHQAGLPLAITASGCNMPFGGTCMPNLNPAHTGPIRINGGWGRKGPTASTTQYIDPTAFSVPAAYTLGNAPRTYAYGLRGPGNYDESLSLRRAFGIWERLKFTFEASLFNVDNHVDYSSPGVSFSSAIPNSTSGSSNAFGTVTGQANSSRRAQFSARLDF